MDAVRLDLVGIDGSAFALLGAFGRAAGRHGWSGPAVKAVTDEASAGGYDRLLRTLVKHTDDPDDPGEDGG